MAAEFIERQLGREMVVESREGDHGRCKENKVARAWCRGCRKCRRFVAIAWQTVEGTTEMGNRKMVVVAAGTMQQM